MAAPAHQLGYRRSRIPRAARPLPQEAEGPAQSPNCRRELHLDRATFETSQGEAHSAGCRVRWGLAAAELRGHVYCGVATVSRVWVFPSTIKGTKVPATSYLLLTRRTGAKSYTANVWRASVQGRSHSWRVGEYRLES